MIQNKNQILGVILAGGLSRRMGNINKSLVKIAGAYNKEHKKHHIQHQKLV